MGILRTTALLLFVSLVACDQKNNEIDTSKVFMDAAQALFSNPEAIGGVQNIISKFMQSDTGKQMMGGGGSGNGIEETIGNAGNLLGAMLGNKGGQSSQDDGGVDWSNLASLFKLASSSGGGVDFQSLLKMFSAFTGQNANTERMLELLPLLVKTFTSDGSNEDGHAAHAWLVPPTLEKIHVLLEDFSKTDIGKTLWTESGLGKALANALTENEALKYLQILEGFENPSLRRQWVSALTTYAADWVAHISDPGVQQRYLKTYQFAINDFLRSKGFPDTAMLDLTKPVQSLTRIINTAAHTYLNMNFDSQPYVKPAVAYVQDLIRLASEKGFIQSRINAHHLGTRLRETINDGFIAPLLKTYRATKWSVKSPQCATHIFCTINGRSNEIEEERLTEVRTILIRLFSYPAASVISIKTGTNFWTLSSAIQQSDICSAGYPSDCAEFHVDELRATTEAIHNEL